MKAKVGARASSAPGAPPIPPPAEPENSDVADISLDKGSCTGGMARSSHESVLRTPSTTLSGIPIVGGIPIVEGIPLPAVTAWLAAPSRSADIDGRGAGRDPTGRDTTVVRRWVLASAGNA